MLPKAEERQTDLRNTSIMEVILAVIIVLLLVVYTKDVEIGNLKEDYERTIADLQKENRTLQDENKRLKSENFKLKREVKDLKSQLDYYEQFIGQDGQSVADLNKKLVKENARMKRELENLRKRIKELELQLRTATTGMGSANKKIEELIAEIASLKDEIERLKKLTGSDQDRDNLLNEIKKLSQEVKRLKEKLLALEKENAEMRKKYGVGAPRCKANDEKVQWLAKIETVDNQFQFEMLAPVPQQTSLISTVPGLKTLIDKKILSKNQFYASALQVYNWGNSQPIQCRFYVKVVRESLDGLDDLDFIQCFFYTGYVK